MRFRKEAALVLGALMIFVLSTGTANAQRFDAAYARGEMIERLGAEYGTGFTKAKSSWVACPQEGILDIYGMLIADCMSQFGSGKKRRFVNATVREDDTVEIFSTRKWKRKWRKCGRGHLQHARIDGTLWANDKRCSTDAHMATDLNYLALIGSRKKRTIVGWPGTNMIGFGKVATYRCKVKRGKTYRFKCRNALGDKFRLKVRT